MLMAIFISVIKYSSQYSSCVTLIMGQARNNNHRHSVCKPDSISYRVITLWYRYYLCIAARIEA